MTAAVNQDAMRKLATFIVLSLIAHMLILYGVPLKLPERSAAPLPLEARLQPAPPPPPVLPRPRPHPHVAPKTAPAEPVAEPVITTAQITAEPAYIATPPAAPEPVMATAPEAVAPSLEYSKPAAKPEPVTARRLPRKGQISYALYLGTDKFNVGRTLQTWMIDNDSYRLTSVSETTGLASFFSRQHLEYVSTGKLTASGLRPEFFGTERLRSGKTEVAAAQFDWNAQSVTFGEPQRSAALTPDAQDIVSFMYQLGLMPMTPGRIELPITNGWKFERYQLEIGSEEQLQTPFGTLRAVPVKQVRRPGEESIELWLSPDYRWLPVRISFFDRQGEPSGEQVVSDIRVSDD